MELHMKAARKRVSVQRLTVFWEIQQAPTSFHNEVTGIELLPLPPTLKYYKSIFIVQTDGFQENRCQALK